MLVYLLRRLIVLPVVTFFVTLILFGLMLQIPLEARVQIYLPSIPSRMTPEDVARLEQQVIERRGLDRPFPVQYLFWVRNLISGDWGFSPSWHEPVLEGLIKRASATAELALAAMIPAVTLALLFGSWAGKNRGRLSDYLVRTTAFVGGGIPSFVLAFLILNLFSIWLGWFSLGRVSPFASHIILSPNYHAYTVMHTVDALLNGSPDLFADALQHLAMPAMALGLTQWALLARIMRAALLDELSQDYITTARAKGLSEWDILFKHAQRNALLPVISVGGVAIPMLISDLIVVETIFNYNGLGGSVARSIVEQDLPVTVGFALVSCLVAVAASLVADLVYGVVDPRVRAF